MGESLRTVAMITGVLFAAIGAVLFGQSLAGANELSPWVGVSVTGFGVFLFLASLFASRSERRGRRANGDFGADLGDLEIGDFDLPD